MFAKIISFVFLLLSLPSASYIHFYCHYYWHCTQRANRDTKNSTHYSPARAAWSYFGTKPTSELQSPCHRSPSTALYMPSVLSETVTFIKVVIRSLTYNPVARDAATPPRKPQRTSARKKQV